MEPEEGAKFGKLTLIKYLEPIRDNSGSLRKIAEVRCDCGNICVKKLKYLKNGDTTSCGSCIKIAVCKPLKGVGDVFKVEPFSDEVDMIGTKVNRWTIIDVGFRFKKSRMMMSVCECGTERMVSKQSLLSGHSVSCGCYSSEVTTNMNTRHGLFGTASHTAWSNMIQRCTNPNNEGYHNYGGRGIVISEDWLTFENFFRDMGHPPEGLTLERLDVNGNYCKDNCVWADRNTQAWNKRKAKNNTSGKTGVWKSRTNKWVTTISVEGKRIHLGTFTTFEEASEARKEAEIKYYGTTKE